MLICLFFTIFEILPFSKRKFHRSFRWWNIFHVFCFEEHNFQSFCFSQKGKLNVKHNLVKRGERDEEDRNAKKHKKIMCSFIWPEGYKVPWFLSWFLIYQIFSSLHFHSSKRKCFLAGCGSEIHIMIVIRLWKEKSFVQHARDLKAEKYYKIDENNSLVASDTRQNMQIP